MEYALVEYAFSKKFKTNHINAQDKGEGSFGLVWFDSFYVRVSTITAI